MKETQTTTLVLYEAERPDPVNHPGTYRWNLDNVLGAGVGRISNFSLKYLLMMVSWYTFKNEVLTYFDGAPKSITLNGNFNDTDFKSIVSTLLGAGYTVDISPTTGRITINTTGPAVTWTFSTWSERLKYFLGIPRGTPDMGPTVSAIFPAPVKLGGDQVLQLTTGRMIANNNNSSQSTWLQDNAFKIPVPVNGFEYINFTPDNFYEIPTVNNNNTRLLAVAFLDQFGNELDLNDGDAVLTFVMS